MTDDLTSLIRELRDDFGGFGYEIRHGALLLTFNVNEEKMGTVLILPTGAVIAKRMGAIPPARQVTIGRLATYWASRHPGATSHSDTVACFHFPQAT